MPGTAAAPALYRSDTGRRAAWLGPVSTAAAGAVALGYVAASNPARHRTLLPPCPFHTATGLWCPGCGLTRATNALLHGHLATALGYNLFTPVLFALIGWSWLAWMTRTLGRPVHAPADVPKPAWIALGVAVAVFAVARNVPVAPLSALAP